MEAGYAIIILITLTGMFLLILSFIFWTSPLWTRRIEHVLDLLDQKEEELAGCLSAIGRCGHMLGHYIHFHAHNSPHIPVIKR